MFQHSTFLKNAGSHLCFEMYLDWGSKILVNIEFLQGIVTAIGIIKDSDCLCVGSSSCMQPNGPRFTHKPFIDLLQRKGRVNTPLSVISVHSNCIYTSL